MNTFERMQQQLEFELKIHNIKFELRDDLEYGLNICITKNKEGTYSVINLPTFIMHHTKDNDIKLIKTIMKKYTTIKWALMWMPGYL